MKMEILAVQNEFMHVMPSTKAKDGSSHRVQWTSPVVQSTPVSNKQKHQKIRSQPQMPQVRSGSHKSSRDIAIEAREVIHEDHEVEDDDEFSFLHNLPHWNENEVEHVRNVLMATLRDAKQRHLSATEVLLPCDILQRITLDMLQASDSEACGIRGANIRIEFEDEEGERRVIATCNTDHNTVATFELCLTLKHAHSRSKWISAIMPQFIRNLTKGTTIVISRDYELRKEKLSCYEFAE